MGSKSKQKNLLDIEHQKYLNYFNVCAITGLTVGFTVVWANVLEQISSELMQSALLLDAVVFAFALLLINNKMAEVVGKIRKL